MNWKNKVISVILSLICTIVLIFSTKKYIPLDSGIIILGMAVFVMFEIICISSYGIIKKRNLKYSIWGVAEGINGLILMLSAFSVAGKTQGTLETTMPIWIVIVSLISFFVISGIGIRIEQNMKKMN